MTRTDVSPAADREMMQDQTHNVLIGYLLWILGVFGAHRFYFGKPISGTIWFLTLGLLGIGWIIDLLLIPGMARTASRRYLPGPYDHNVAWILLTFLAWLGAHRFYLGKWGTGLVYVVLTLLASTFILAIVAVPILLLFYLYDFWTLNEQVDDRNVYA